MNKKKTLRYRVQNKSSLVGVFVDRSAFDKSFYGKNPNNPIGGLITMNGKKYPFINYEEFSGSNYSENEFHEKEQDWYVNIFVE